MQGFNRQTDEFTQDLPRHAQPDEFNALYENPPYVESASSPETTTDSGGKKPKKKGANLLTTMLLTATAVTVGVSTVPALQEGLLPSKGARVEIVELTAYDDDLYYTVDILSGEGLSVTVKNDETNRREEINPDNESGVFENLKPNMKYTFSVVGKGALGDTTLVSMQITMPSLLSQTTASLVDLEIDGETATVTVNIDGPATLSARLNGTHSTDASQGTHALIFDNLQYGKSYRFTLIGKDLSGEHEMLGIDFEIDEPIIETATVTSASYGTTSAGFAVSATTDGVLTVRLYNDSESHTREIGAGKHQLTFDNLTAGAAYTLVIEGKNELHRSEITLPQPENATILEIVKDKNNLYFDLEIHSYTGTKAVLEHGDESYTQALANGKNRVEFTNLKWDTEYMLTIIGDGEILREKVKTPHALEFATAEIGEFTVGSTGLDVTVNVSAEVPLQAVVYNADERFVKDLINGQNTLKFEGLTSDKDYTFAVIGIGAEGEKQLASRQFKTEKENASSVEFISYTADQNAMYFTVKVDSVLPLKAVLSNDTFNQSVDLVNGENKAAFRNVSLDTLYTFSVVEIGADGERVIYTREEYSPHPIEFVEVWSADYGFDGNGVIFFPYVETDLPLTLYLYNDYESYSVPLAQGDNEILIEGVTFGASYTLSIRGEGRDGEVEVFSDAIDVPTALDMSYGTMYEFTVNAGAADLASVDFVIYADSPLTLEAVVYDDNDRFTMPLTNGEATVTFDDLTLGGTYTFAIVAHSDGGEVEIYQEQVVIQ